MQGMAPDVLVVEDDQGIREALEVGLELEGFEVRSVSDGLAGLAAIEHRPPDIVVLDVGLPGLNGVALLRRLRVRGNSMPVCILSARDEIDDRVAGLEAGADDYVVKPFALGELAARLHALVRLYRRETGRPLLLGDLTIEPSRRAASHAGRDLDLTVREFDLLAALARHSGQVLTRQQLLEQVWGYTWEVDSNVVDVFVGYIRKKLESNGEKRILQTVRGVGFVLRI